MKTVRILYHLARADFLERARSYSFLLMLAATMYLGYSVNRGDLYLQLDGYRGVLNSAWVGGMMASVAILIVTLFGFYLVKNTIERDTVTGVGQIIAATPTRSVHYLLGKWLSNWAVLSALTGILMVAAVLMQLLGGESARLEPGPLILPFLFLALPALAVVASLAIVFETVSWLRGGLGNVVYFILWMSALTVALLLRIPWLDWSGMLAVYQSMGEALGAVHPGYTGSFDFTSQPPPEGGLHIFVWQGIRWTTPMVAGRALWVLGSSVLILLGSAFFHRFDPSLEKPIRLRQARTDGGTVDASVTGERADLRQAHLGTIAAGVLQFRYLRLFLSEFRLMVKGQRWWWYAGLVVGIIGGLASPVEVARRAWLPAAWLWPLFIWSPLGTRETRHQTAELVFSSSHPLTRQLPVTWMVGLGVTLLCGSGVGLQLLLSGAWAPLGAWLAGACFIPSLAIALGVWSGTTRLFEIVYLLIWYLGPLHPIDMPRLDFMGAADGSLHANLPVYVALLTLALLASCFAGRKRQLMG